MTDADRRLDELRQSGKPAIARLLSELESPDGLRRHAELLDAAAGNRTCHRIGITGPPGVGKSTLTNRLVEAWRGRGDRVAVIAVDPSSQLTGGALLGDRARITTDPDDRGTFIRSFAARDRLGGLSDHAIAALHLLSAFYDKVLIESVGIGQSESDLAHAVDTLLLCIQPGSGDSLQFMKAGIMELPDIVLVTKADMEREAKRALADVEGALSLSAGATSGHKAPVIPVSSIERRGVDDVLRACDSHREGACADGGFDSRRTAQTRHWLNDALRRRYGSFGLTRIEVGGVLDEAPGLYSALVSASKAIERDWP